MNPLLARLAMWDYLKLLPVFWEHLDCYIYTCVSYFSCCPDTISDKNTLTKGLFHHLGKVCAQNSEVPDYIVSTVRKQGTLTAGTQLIYPVYSAQGTALDRATHIQGGSSLLLKQPHRYTQRSVSSVIPNLVKVTRKMKYRSTPEL